MCRLDLHGHQIAAHSVQHAGDQPGLLRLPDDVHDGPANGNELLSRDVGVWTNDVPGLRHVGIAVWLRVDLEYDHDRLRSLQCDRERLVRYTDDLQQCSAEDRLHLGQLTSMDPGSDVRMESIRPRGQHDRLWN
uniref:(northern house mosquito) hypothetical protein n=1 Tax=Culex pipiens TaxID=7175 RepID=A0A8D8L6X5_CULPI